MNATITLAGNKLSIGSDFVDAATGHKQSHGWIELGNRSEFPNGSFRYEWESTLPINVSESALRQEAKREGRRVTGFMSQAL